MSDIADLIRESSDLITKLQGQVSAQHIAYHDEHSRRLQLQQAVQDRDSLIAMLRKEIDELRADRAAADICRKFVREQQISCAECVHQSDRVIENAYAFIESICNHVGYYREDDK